MATGSANRILVTGGAGFIGSHLCDRLLGAGAAVHCLDNFDPFYDPALKRSFIRAAQQNPAYTLTEGDLCEPAVLDAVFAWKPDAVVHLAALAGVRPSIDEPSRYMRVNVEGTSDLLQRCVHTGVSRVVFASSSSVYGNRKTVPFHEDDRVDDPVSPYAASKKAGELIAHTFHALHGLPVTCLRFFTVYGPRQRPEMAIHKFVAAVLAGQPVTLFGDGQSSRDYTYIDDIVDGIVAAIERPAGYAVVNLGEAHPIALVELVDLIESLAGKTAIRRFLPMQPGDVERTFADIGRARDLLGYAPKIGLREGIGRFIEWYRQSGLAA